MTDLSVWMHLLGERRRKSLGSVVCAGHFLTENNIVQMFPSWTHVLIAGVSFTTFSVTSHIVVVHVCSGVCMYVS